MNSLPFELVDEIIGHVDEQEDRPSRPDLAACSLVCSLWLPSSQRRLFHRITFHEWGSGQITLHADVHHLDQILLNSPHITSYIRVLDLTSLATYGPYEYDEYGEPTPPDMIAIEKQLSSLLSKFTHLQKLKIWRLHWNALAGDFRQSLCRVLALPSMAFLYIDGTRFICMDDLTNFINHARGPIGLSLNHIVIDTSWDPPHSFELEPKETEVNNDKLEGHRICRLTRLDMWCNSIFFNRLLGPRLHLDLSHVHTLHICLPKADDDSVNRLLCAIGRSLKHVSIFMPYGLPVLVNLAFNVNIEFLSLVHVNMVHESLSTLSRILSSVDASNHIHHIDLRVVLRNDRRGRGVDWAAWDEVYRVLAGPHFQFLRVLHINIRSYPYDPLFQRSNDMLAAHPLLATRGVRVSPCFLPDHKCIFCSAEGL
ncbi:hypothetical protein JB92DRAFT_2882938 [Gautieria morchelliformis]|nr:hypothetical protein JB92DRAFT_2882938 [Gautieria morchelliformis]